MADPILDDLLDLMYSTVSWSTHVGVNGYGDPSYSTSVNTAKARIKFTPGVTSDNFGDDVVLTHQITIGSTVPIPATVLFTLADGSQPNLLRVEAVYDENGLHHQVGYFGARSG